MLAASYSKRDHVLALTEMQARETKGQVSKTRRNKTKQKKGAVQTNRNMAIARQDKQGKPLRVKAKTTWMTALAVRSTRTLE